MLFSGQNTVLLRHSKIVKNEIVMKEVDNRDWQYSFESVIQLVEGDKSHLNTLPKREKKIIKSMKHNYRVARRVYASTYANIAEQFKIYLNSLPPDEIDEIENDFQANGNSLLFISDIQITVKLFDSFAMFYYINGSVLYTDGHLFVSDGETPPGIIGKKLSLKELFAKSFQSKSNGLVSFPFLAALLLFLAGKETLVKRFLTDLYRNLTVEVMTSNNDSILESSALTDLCAEIDVRFGNAIFVNHGRARLAKGKKR